MYPAAAELDEMCLLPTTPSTYSDVYMNDAKPWVEWLNVMHEQHGKPSTYK